MSTNDPAMLQFPGLLAAVVNDALKDGVPPGFILEQLDAVKRPVVTTYMRQSVVELSGPVRLKPDGKGGWQT